jgi:hypothetical protein
MPKQQFNPIRTAILKYATNESGYYKPTYNSLVQYCKNNNITEWDETIPQKWIEDSIANRKARELRKRKRKNERQKQRENERKLQIQEHGFEICQILIVAEQADTFTKEEFNLFKNKYKNKKFKDIFNRTGCGIWDTTSIGREFLNELYQLYTIDIEYVGSKAHINFQPLIKRMNIHQTFTNAPKLHCEHFDYAWHAQVRNLPDLKVWPTGYDYDPDTI